jgi:hypothetical protein
MGDWEYPLLTAFYPFAVYLFTDFTIEMETVKKREAGFVVCK